MVATARGRAAERYRGVCEACGAHLPAGATAVYDQERRKVRCVECPTMDSPEPETAKVEVEAASELRVCRGVRPVWQTQSAILQVSEGRLQ